MIIEKLKYHARVFIRKMLLLMPVKGISRPVFILGCGRSGTTILGTTLSKHSKVTYLNERRDLWFAAYPETDIWTAKATARNGKMILSAEDTEIRKSKKLHKLFWMETIMPNRPIFIEKLPINNFRLDFINTIFPDALYIHIYRNGLEVASSIEKIADTGRWFGANKYKWNQLVNIANEKTQTMPLAELCASNYDKGLLEWRLSTEAAVNFLNDLPRDRFLEVSYYNLTNKPTDVIEQIFSFIGVDNETDVAKFANEKISRRSKKINGESISEKEKIIGGDLLKISLNNENNSGLSKHYDRIIKEEDLAD